MNPDDSQHTPNANHEPDVVKARAIWWSGAALVSLIAVSLILMQALSDFFAKSLPAVPATASNEQLPAQFPAAAPPLNPNQRAALADLRAAEHVYLNEYGWVDRQAGVARIPIARAMEIVSQSGLPPAVGKPSTTGSQSRE